MPSHWVHQQWLLGTALSLFTSLLNFKKKNKKKIECFAFFTHTGVYFNIKQSNLNIWTTSPSRFNVKLLQGTCVASEKKQFALVPHENLGGAALPLLLLPASGSSDHEGWAEACALANSSHKYSEGRGAEEGWENYRKTDPDRSGRWNRRTATRPNDKGADYPNCFPYFPSFLSLFYAQGSFSFCKAGRCPDPHLAFPSGPPCGSHLWLLWWCTRCSLTPTHLPPPPLTKDLQPRGSGRASWRGRWFSWMSTPAARSESSTTTSCLCSWTPRSSKMVGSTF